MHPTIPPALTEGDLISIISTARKVDERYIELARKVFEEWGFRTLTGRNLFKAQGQFAGSDAERLQDLNEAIHNTEVKAILCARGGYGTGRIIDGIDLKGLAAQPKWIGGYSDITALLLHVYKHTGIAGIHCTMPVNFDDNTEHALSSLKNVLMGTLENTEALHHRLNRDGIAEGELIGGNLSVIYSLLGSNSLPDMSGKVLFLEDIDEYLYHIDRMMVALKRAGLLGHLAGVIVGGLTDMRDNPVPFGKTPEEIVAEHLEAYAYPVCFNFPAGHISDNRAWIHGKKVRLTVYHDQPSTLNQS